MLGISGSSMHIKEWQKLEYYNPHGVLVALLEFERTHQLSKIPYAIASLRTNQLRTYREGRQCALFCYGMSKLLGIEILFAFNEKSDTDFVGKFEASGVVHYVPIQVKELVPDKVLSNVEIQDEIDKLSKYTDSQGLVVAFHINRNIRIELFKVDFSRVPVKELWFFGATNPDVVDWVLIGDLLSPNIRYFEFNYPEA